MPEIREVEDLRDYFAANEEIVDSLPVAQEVEDFKTVYIKSGSDYKAYKMINGVWYLIGTLTEV